MMWRRLVSCLAAFAALSLMRLGPALPQTARGQGPRQDVAPCFRTDVPAHPFDLVLGRPTATSVTASVLSYAAAEGYIEWGTAPGQYIAHSPTVAFPAGEPVNVAMQPLQPDTAYWYRLRLGTTVSDEHHFRTQRPPGASFTFTLTADPHLDERCTPELYAATLRHAAAANPDFHVDLGDTFMAEKVRPLGLPILPMYLAQRTYFGLLCADAPLYFVIGNHDGEIATQDPEARALRMKMLPNPLPDGFYSGNEGAPLGNYYAWTWGDALFVVLDPFSYTTARIRTAEDNWGRTLGETQYRWLQRTLEGSHAAFKFVFIHHLVGGLGKDARGGAEAAPYFEWGGHSPDGTDQFAARRPGWGLPIHRLLVQTGVTAVFHGHDHFYDRQELDGIVYQECPQPGWAGGDRVGQAAEYGYKSGDILASSGHLRVQVTPTAATVTYVRSRPGTAAPTIAASYRLTPRRVP